MNPVRGAIMVMSGVALLLLGCGKKQDSAKVAQKPYAYPEVRMSAPGDQVARAESLAFANRMVTYQNPAYRYRFRYDSQKARLEAVDNGDVNVLRGSEQLARIYAFSVARFYHWA